MVGTATNGRNRPELQGLVGNMVNMVALRTRLQPKQTFNEASHSACITHISALVIKSQHGSLLLCCPCWAYSASRMSALVDGAAGCSSASPLA